MRGAPAAADRVAGEVAADSAAGFVEDVARRLFGLAALEYDPECCNPVQVLEDLEDDREWFRDDPPPNPDRTPTPGTAA